MQKILFASGLAATHAFAGIASADLLIELRTLDGGKDVQVSQVGERVVFQVYGVITGTSGTNDGLQTIQGSYLSGFGGMLVDIVRVEALAPFNVGSRDTVGPNRAQIIDLDGDGDIDVGGEDGSAVGNFVLFRAASLSDGPQTEFLVGEVEIEVKDFSGGDSTTLNGSAPKVMTRP